MFSDSLKSINQVTIFKKKKSLKPVRKVMKAPNSPWVNTPLEWWCSPGWTATWEGSSATSHSTSLSCQKAETRHGCWPPTAWSPSSSLWHKRSGFGRWQPLARPCARNSSQLQRRSGLILLQGATQDWPDVTIRTISYNNTKRFLDNKDKIHAWDFYITWGVTLPFNFGT